MKPVTIKEMAAIMSKAVKDGYGDCVLLVSDDEEANGYHALFEGKCRLGMDDYRYRSNGCDMWANTITIE